MKINTDFKYIFDALTLLNSTTGKRLLINLSMHLEFFENRDISETVWKPGAQNPTDWLTKVSNITALRQLMHT